MDLRPTEFVSNYQLKKKKSVSAQGLLGSEWCTQEAACQQGSHPTQVSLCKTVLCIQPKKEYIKNFTFC